METRNRVTAAACGPVPALLDRPHIGKAEPGLCPQGFLGTHGGAGAIAGRGEEQVNRGSELSPRRNDATTLRHSARQNAGLHYREVNQPTKGRTPMPRMGAHGSSWYPNSCTAGLHRVFVSKCFCDNRRKFFSKHKSCTKNTCHSTP